MCGPRVQHVGMGARSSAETSAGAPRWLMWQVPRERRFTARQLLKKPGRIVRAAQFTPSPVTVITACPATLLDNAEGPHSYPSEGETIFFCLKKKKTINSLTVWLCNFDLVGQVLNGRQLAVLIKVIDWWLMMYCHRRICLLVAVVLIEINSLLIVQGNNDTRWLIISWVNWWCKRIVH